MNVKTAMNAVFDRIEIAIFGEDDIFLAMATGEDYTIKDGKLERGEKAKWEKR